MKEPTWITYLTISLAGIGAILGIINTAYLLFKDRVRIRLSVRNAFFVNVSPHQDGQTVFALEVTNLGFLPVTISQAGFELPDGSNNVIPLLGHNTPTGVQLPHRLEPRTSLSIYASIPETDAIKEHGCKKAFVKTDCKRTYKAKRNM